VRRVGLQLYTEKAQGSFGAKKAFTEEELRTLEKLQVRSLFVAFIEEVDLIETGTWWVDGWMDGWMDGWTCGLLAGPTTTTRSNERNPLPHALSPLGLPPSLGRGRGAGARALGPPRVHARGAGGVRKAEEATGTDTYTLTDALVTIGCRPDESLLCHAHGSFHLLWINTQ
jgi:hypothetical protein